MLIQYMIGPKMVEWSMGVRYVTEAGISCTSQDGF